MSEARTTTDTGLVTPEVAENVLWLKYPATRRTAGPGHFLELLMEAISRADLENQAKLAAGFPEYVAAWRMSFDDLYSIARPGEAR